MSKKTLHIVFQTHWDREWYMTFEAYRYRLIHVMKRVIDALDHEEIETFVLDGQTLPLDDYLEVCEPIEKEKVIKYIQNGQLVIGPWFIAMDEFLVHGESIIRNLELGHKKASIYGQIQKLGYIPDTFGHIGQMPQILNGFGISNAMMWRGVDPEKSEFIWEGIDGSSLFTIFLSEGYYQPILNQPDYVKATDLYIQKIAPLSHTNDLLLTAGGDHLMPINEALDQRMSQLKNNLDSIDIKVSDYITYINLLKEQININHLQIIKGELRDNSRCYILPNVLSTRSYLKINNQILEDLMLYTVEPLLATAYLFSHLTPYTYVDFIWKTILENQPHDSICGCSIDMVHQDNEMRFDHAMEKIKSLLTGLFEQHGGLSMTYYSKEDKQIFEDDEKFSIFNPHPFIFNEPVECNIWLDEKNELNQGFIIADEQGNTYQTKLINIHEDRLFASPLDYPPAFRRGKTYQVRIQNLRLKPTAVTRFILKPHAFDVMNASDTQTIENKWLKVSIENDGTLSIFDKRSQKTYEHMHQFYSEMDQGDSYNYAKPEIDLISIAELAQVHQTFYSNDYQMLSYQLILEQPKGLDESRKMPLDEKVHTLIDVTVKLGTDDQLVFQTRIDQKGMDQRLRIKYPLTKIIDSTTSDTAFELKKRRANREESFIAQRLKEVDVVVDPSLSLIMLEDEIAIFHRGLHEYQTKIEGQITGLHHTLIRSVGYLSHDDFKTRGGAAGPNLKAFEAQCLRIHNFDYVVKILNVEKSASQLYRLAHTFRNPPKKFRAYPQTSKSLFHIDNDDIHMSSLRQIDVDQIEVRLWNPKDVPLTISLNSEYDISKMNITNMLKETKNSASSRLHIKPNEILTIQLTYKNSGHQ